VIFSTGRGEVPIEYTSLIEEMASNGYIVASAANTYTGPTVVFPDGRIVPSGDQEPNVQQLLNVCEGDIGTVFKQLAALNADPRSLFSQRIDLKRVAIIGHSWGGAVSADFCSVDDRCTAGIDLDGGLYGGAAQKGIHKPFLFLASEDAPPYLLRLRMILQPGLKGRWAEVRQEEHARWHIACGPSPQCRIESLPGMRHLNFGDLGILFRRPLYWVHPMLGRIGGQASVRITREKLRDFLNRSVPGSS
jgi:pimeloyl-ACP methyl ester carboxylesterase